MWVDHDSKVFCKTDSFTARLCFVCTRCVPALRCRVWDRWFCILPLKSAFFLRCIHSIIGMRPAKFQEAREVGKYFWRQVTGTFAITSSTATNLFRLWISRIEHLTSSTRIMASCSRSSLQSSLAASCGSGTLHRKIRWGFHTTPWCPSPRHPMMQPPPHKAKTSRCDRYPLFLHSRFPCGQGSHRPCVAVAHCCL